jgi:hypothetical protein
MSTGSRFALSITKLCSALIIGLGIAAPPASGEQSQGQYCNEFQDEFNQTAHMFGAGACYKPAPGVYHASWNVGYCHTFHSDC